MKKYLFPILAIAAVAAAPAAYARTMHPAGSWHVLMSSADQACYAANRTAISGEVTISGPYASEAKALSAISGDVQCDNPQGTT